MVRELALRAERMGREQWELVLHMMHHAREIVDRIKAEPKKPGEQPKPEADIAGDDGQAEEHNE